MNNLTERRLPDSYAICLIGHGSRDPEGTREFLTLWKKLAERNFCRITEYGFLEFARPSATEALAACHQKGVENIISLPGILLPGKHTQNDIPEVFGKVFHNTPEINPLFPRPLGFDSKIMEACQGRIKDAEKLSSNAIPHSKTLLAILAHGSRDSRINSEAEKKLVLLGKEMGFAKTVVHFAGTSKISMEDIFENLRPQDFSRVILLPFFLFTGVWVKRVHALSDTLQRKHTKTEFLKTSCLQHHDSIVDALIQRVAEVASGQ